MDAFEAAAAALVGDPNMGRELTVTPVAGDPRTIRGVWFDAEAGAVMQEEPAALAQASDVADIASGAQVAVDGVNYVVRYREADGRGLVRLVVERL